MHSGQIIKLLELKHRLADDIFVPECKDGPTHSGPHFRLDAWVMKKSWANACAIGYEVKVNRSDFLNDGKWPNYLPLCNEFYFVCPADLIAPEELPESVGLYYVSKNGTSLRCKRKAAYRDIQIPRALYQYILMCRVHIKGDSNPYSPEHKQAYWRQWLEEKKLDTEFGWKVSKSIKERVDQEILKVGVERDKALALVESVRDSLDLLKSNGIDLENTKGVWDRQTKLRNKVEEINGKLPDGLVQYLNNTERNICYIREALTSLLKGEQGD